MSEPTPSVVVVIPTYNHTATVRDVVIRALQVHDRVLVVDDGTTVGDVAAELRDLPAVRLLRFPQNRGKGAAILAAAAEAEQLGATHIVTLDADGQHDPADLPRLLEVVRARPQAVVVGRRLFAGPHVPFSSRFGREFSNFWFRLQTGQAAADTQSGFRAYPLAVLRALRLRETRYSFEVEVLVQAAWAGVPVVDVPISVHYPPPAERVSHFHAVADNLRLSWLNTRLTLRSLLPWPHVRLVSAAAQPVPVSLRHPWQSVRTLLGADQTPARLAAAVALGVFLGAVPLIACHTIAILFVAGYLGLHKVAALVASQLCMPPLVPALCIEVGYLMRHGDWLREASLRTLGYQGLARLWEWLLGSLVVGPLLALLVGGIVYGMAAAVEVRCRDASP